ncbi:MAG: transporter substrate-binding domain-containing protein [Desulfobacterales bacterium]|nr:transporter substrate-binding domain-containing protein [Desulfobacterales bacterium]
MKLSRPSTVADDSCPDVWPVSAAATMLPAKAPLSAQELTGALGRIEASGRIRIGYREAEPPHVISGWRQTTGRLHNRNMQGGRRGSRRQNRRVVEGGIHPGGNGRRFGALRQKKINAFSSDQVVLIGLALKAEDTAIFAVKSDVFSNEPFALAVRRNDADFLLVADRVIAALYRSRRFLPIYDKWVGKYDGRRPPVFDAMVQINATPEYKGSGSEKPVEIERRQAIDWLFFPGRYAQG